MRPFTLHPTPGDQIAAPAPDHELAPPRPRTVMRMRTRIAAGEYVVDPQAVADAIAERVFDAGLTSSLHARAA